MEIWFSTECRVYVFSYQYSQDNRDIIFGIVRRIRKVNK